MSKYLLNQVFFQTALNNQKLFIIDGGARGSIFSPIDKIAKDFYHVYRFEPDPDAAIHQSKNETIFRKALWSDNVPLTLNVASKPSTSSIFPPNKELLKQFPDHLGYAARKTVKQIELEGVGIDKLVASREMQSPQLVKLDIHGAEYEALSGALTALDNTVLAVMVETWTMPLHKGQKTHGHVEALLNLHGFYLFKDKKICQWSRKELLPAIYSEPQVIAYDNLYFKVDSTISTHQKLQLIGLLNLYDHNDYLLHVLEQSEIDCKEEIKSFLSKNTSSSKFWLKSVKKYFAKKIFSYLN